MARTAEPNPVAPRVADECLRNLVRRVEDIRGDLDACAPSTSKFPLRRGERYPGPPAAWRAKHLAQPRSPEFDDARSRTTSVEYLVPSVIAQFSQAIR